MPFFFVVDDAGLPTVHPNGTGPRIDYSAYENLLALAKEYGMRIPLCFTLKFVDVHHVSGLAEPVSYAGELLDLVRGNSQYLEAADHGLTHEFRGSCYEFFDPHTREALPEPVQRERVQTCAAIWDSVGFEFPEIFVPPAHGWQPGVTDRIYADQGTRYLISLPREKTTIESLRGLQRLNIWRWWKPVYHWPGSSYLTFLPRASMGLNSTHLVISDLRSRFVRKSLDPDCRWPNVLLQRQLSPWSPHSYMTHIGNFVGRDNLAFWRELLDWVRRQPGLRLAHSSEEAMRIWQELPERRQQAVTEGMR
jgi:hypothetical protein